CGQGDRSRPGAAGRHYIPRVLRGRRRRRVAASRLSIQWPGRRPGEHAMQHPEHHRSARTGWLRAAVLGANDGVVSIAGLVVGVAASGASATVILASGVAGTVAGAFSMAAGEYVSVQSQADTERADLAQERKALAEQPAEELAELAGIHQARGLDAALAMEVARQLTAHDALAAHARDELGFHEAGRPRPLQAATSIDRTSTRLYSSHVKISYAVF